MSRSKISFIKVSLLKGLQSFVAGFAVFALLGLIPAGALHAASSASTQLKFRVDTLAPDSISDLTVQTATGTEGALILNWTEPGNDGMSGQASAYLVRISTSGNINNNVDFGTATLYNSNWSPGSGGGVTAQMPDTLTPGQTYYWAIRTRDPAGLTAPWSRNGVNLSNYAVAWDSAPAAVQGVGASAGDENVSVSWNNLTLAERTTDFNYYRLYRSSMPTFSPETILTTTTGTSYLDSSITLTTYYYRVLGVDKGFNSVPAYPGNALESITWSTVSTKPLLPAPTNFTSLSASTESITWTWVDNATLENGYRINATSGGVVGSTEAVFGRGTTVQWTESNLIPGTSYQRYVVAFETNTVSGASASSLEYTLPNPILALESSSQTAQTATLNWNTNNNGPFVHYIVERATHPSVTYTTIADITTNTYVNSGLAEGATYNYQLRARNGEGSESTLITLTTTTLIVPPSRVTNLTALVGSQEGTLHLRWLAPGDDDTVGNITGGRYDIRWSTGDIVTDYDFDVIAAPYQKIIATNTVRGALNGTLITGLASNVTYFFALKTRDEIANNYSAFSNVISAFSQVDVASPSAITNLVAARSGNTSALLTWIAPGDDGTSGNNVGGSYDIRYASTPISTLSQFLSAASASSFGAFPAPGVVGSSESVMLNGLPLDSTYYFVIRAQDESSNASGLSNPATLYTLDIVAPNDPSNFTAQPNAAVGGRIDLAWNNPSASDLRGLRLIYTTTGYAVSPSTAGVNYYDFLITSGSLVSSYAHTGLVAGVTYFYTLFAFDDEPSPNFSNGVTASTLVYTSILRAPSKPTRVMSHRAGSNFVISWTTPTTRVDGNAISAGELAYYKVMKTQTLRGATVQMAYQPVSSGTVHIDALSVPSVFYYRVRAVNIAGQESEDSDAVSSPETADSDGEVYIMMDDQLSYLKVPSRVITPIYRNNVNITGVRQPREEGGKVFKSMNVFATNNSNNQLVNTTIFDEPVQISIGYLVDGNGTVSNGAPALAFSQALPAVAAAPTALSIYWFNGGQWIKLGTQFDPANNSASVKSRHLGGYQLRLVSQASVQNNSVFPRTITPNGDGANDVAFFFFENKTGAQASGTIYDLRSAKVASVRESNIFVADTSVLTWDGKDDSGAVVPGGVYLYKMEVGGESFTGSVVVAK